MFKYLIFTLVCLSVQLSSVRTQSCTAEGFFRNPTDCTKFYRCVDQWQNGRELTIFHFDCPQGTVFDEAVSVCNWPQAAAPCDNGPVQPIAPVAPVGPVAPVDAVAPVEPAVTTAPVEPVAPVEPAVTAAPVEPVGGEVPAGGSETGK